MVLVSLLNGRDNLSRTQAQSAIYVWQLGVPAFNVSQTTSYNFTFSLNQECTQVIAIRAGFKYLSLQNGNPRVIGPSGESVTQMINDRIVLRVTRRISGRMKAIAVVCHAAEVADCVPPSPSPMILSQTL